METSKKKMIIITSIVAVVLVIIIGAVIFLNMSRIEVVNDFTIEFGEKIPSNVTEYLKEDTDEKIIENATIEILGLDKELEYPATGEYIVKVTYKNQTKEVVVTVEDTTEPVFVDFKSELNIYTGETVDWNTLFSAEDLSEVTIEVDDSAVNYSAEGSYKIIVNATDTSDNSISQTATVNVTQTSLSINATSVSMKKGQTYTLQSNVVGRNTTATYTSSDTSVATVDGNGKIVGVGKGNATITVEANGLTLTCEVTVTVASKTTSSNKNSNSDNTNNNGSQEENEEGSGSGFGTPDGWTDESDDWDPDNNIDSGIDWANP